MKIVARIVGMQPGADYCDYCELLIAVVCASAVSLIPKVGWIASVFVLFFLLRKFTSGSLSEILSMVPISRVAALLVMIPLIP